ncbi:MAG: restriction endonuclease subunit S [Lachnospiraceae bacterium]|nr:restriction endonuclease subunit S [Lachnospiraceae bacterium]
MKNPKIRFKGYTDDWKQRKLGEAVNIYSGKDYKHLNEGDIPVYGTGGYMLSVSEALSDDKDAIGIGRKGTIDKPYILKAPFWTVDTLFYCIPNDGYNLNFSFDIFQNINWKAMDESTGVPSLSKTIINNINILVPLYEEQKKIGEYLQSIDRLITLHQQKCEETKTLKKYMLQKMFPQNGTNIPEIRFNGFTDAWEQRRFSEFTFPIGEKNKNDLQLEAYAITNEHGFIPQNEAHDDFGYMKNTDRTAYNIVRPNSFAYNPARINVGSIGYYDGQENVIVSSLYEVFQTEEYVDDGFLWQWFKADEFPGWIERLQEGSVRQYFYYDKLCECEVMMPRVEEQRQIAAYFSFLDHLITLHQQKCDELQSIKKFMLQNMFV